MDFNLAPKTVEREEFVISDNIVITNVENFKTFMKNCTGEEYEPETLKDRVENLENVVYYFDDHFRRVNKERAFYAWADTGTKDKNGNTVWLSLMKSFGVFNGFIVGTAQYLSERASNRSAKYSPDLSDNIESFMKKYYENNGVVEVDMDAPENQPHADIADVVNTIRKMLLIDNWESLEGFRRCLLTYGSRIKYYVENNKTDYFVKNSFGSVIFNTGLLDKYGKSILTLYRYFVKEDSYRPYMVIQNKSQYIENGFTKEDAMKELKPIRFLDKDAAPLSVNLAEYDMNFEHCINDRKNRFPENMQDIPDLYLAQRIKTELATGLSIHKIGGSYAKPIYKAKEQSIQWLLPLHINTGIEEAPELVMVIRNRNDFYEVCTILPYDTGVKDNIRSSNPYANLW